MPTFDFTSEVDMVAMKNAVDVVARQVDNRYDFKGTSAKLELNEKDKIITLYGDSDFHLDQIKDLLFPAMEKKEKESVKRLDHQTIQKISGNKVKQELKIKDGIESDLAKKIVKLIKDGKLKVQASIQGDEVRVQGAKRDDLQACIALVTKSITDFPIKYGNFRD
ncbi:MAG: YajQ family cyclic di-GMP-binding protein [Betaproteobacteria bacterium]|jgi:cyclic-di-GMP-binding protein|nr:YajQ family cyclic di-GMP-binding protein [Betaproteobacteria bacterium]MBK9785999.1 YajQ family cyclic di-GMP-binding protein [Candidatus Dechloromonas phosphorivorans]